MSGSPRAVPFLRKGSQGPSQLGEPVPLRAFFWNVHWQCSLASQGSSTACKERAARRFVELARAGGAEVVASIELSHGMHEPVGLAAFGLDGWSQVNGPCARGEGGDAVALAFAPGWRLEASGGGCLRHDWDARAFAVALATPPAPVQGCPALCVVALHAPHTQITAGRDEVLRVCGDAAVHQCTVAMGDWNLPASDLWRMWVDLIDSVGPSFAEPDERTCCFPESSHYGVYDHVSTNIPGAVNGGHMVHPYQITEENPIQQHRPISLRLLLPAATH